jgi:hypothetical protein
MKKFISLFIILQLSFFILLAQPPQAIPYQAVARDNSGNPLVTQTISLLFSIHDSIATGTVVYQETHSVITNMLGLITANIGQGTVVSGTFVTIDWGGGSKFIQVEMDTSGGSNFVDMGTQQMLSVPFALLAAKSSDLPAGIANGNTLRWNGTAWIIDSNLTNTSLNVGVGTTSPDSSAILDARSNSKGFLMPRMTTAQRNAIAGPAIGLQIFNLDDQCEDIYDGNNWIKTCGLKVTSTVTDPGHPTPNSWTQKAGLMDTARYNAVGFSIGSKGYIGTGKGANWNSYKNDFWEYDPSTNAWTQKANFGGSARYGAVGFSIGSKGYIGTGFDGSYQNDFWEYDPSTNGWTQKAAFSGIARYKAVGFSIGSKGYIGIGGGLPGYTNDFWEYDPSTNGWIQKANFAGTGRIEAVSFSIGSKGYIGTGWDGTLIRKIDFWEYDPSTNGWTQKANFGGVDRSSAVGFSIGNKGYIGTGFNISAYLNDFWEYDPSTNDWTQKANVGGAGRSEAVGFSIGNKGYVGTGTGANFYNDFWEYMDDNIISIYSSYSSSIAPNNSISDGAWTLFNNNVYNDNTGNVGIGTTTPSHKLEVRGNLWMGNQQPSSGFTPINDAIYLGSPRQYLSNTLGDSIDGSFNWLNLMAHPFASGILFGTSGPSDTDPHSSPNPIMVVRTSGNVGIGTASPAARLDVTGTIKITDGTEGTGKVLTSDSDGIASWQTIPVVVETDPRVSSTTTNQVPKWNGTTLTDGIITDDGTNVGIGTVTPSNKLTVNGDADFAGSVGIGTTTPSHKLEVRGNLWMGNQQPSSGFTPINDAIYLGSPRQYLSNTLGASIDGSFNWLNLMAHPFASGILFGTSGPSDTDPHSSPNPIMVVRTSGNVGIGTATPAARLDVTGTIKITDGTEGTGKVLTSDTSGIASWQTIPVVAETDPQVSSATINQVPKWNGTALTDGIITDDGTNVGIGTSSPSYKLDVSNGDIGFAGDLRRGVSKNLNVNSGDCFGIEQVSVAQSGSVAMLRLYTSSVGSSAIGFGKYTDATSFTEFAQFDNSGNLGIGITSPSQKLHVDGNICYTGSISACSDKRYKKSIVPLSCALEKVLKMQGVSYYWKTEEFNDKSFDDNKQIGVIAQEIEKLYPELVTTDKNGYKSVDYSRLTPILVEAIKELKKENDALQARINSSDEEISKIKAHLGIDLTVKK